MKSMVRLSVAILNQISDETGISTAQDQKTVLERVGREGFSFLTITLPQMEKELISLLHPEGRITSTSFAGFRKRGGVPEFLGGLLGVLFSPDGVYQVPVTPEDWSFQAQVIRGLRQFLLLFKKVEFECKEERVKATLLQYIDTDSEVPEHSPEDIARFRTMSDTVLGQYLTDVEVLLYSGDTFDPRHSGGALATRESFNERFALTKWSQRLNEYFPFWDYLSVNWKDSLTLDPHLVPHAEETPSKVTTVPKTLKGPRVIAMEPAWNQYIQQGIMRLLEETLSHHAYRPVWEGITWKYQDFNRLLAQIGSERGNLATVDLSEASDRVSNQLVRDGLLGSHSFLSGAIQACRSERADVAGSVITLRKFASMGSSLTFPMETMVFYIIVHLAWERAKGQVTRPLTPEDGVRVYGDDIIVPKSLVPYLLEELQLYGLKVNHNKSFWTGLFRESCGSDWFAGFPVNTVKVSAPFPTSRHHADNIRRTIELHNNLISFGWSAAAEHVERHLLSLRYVPYGPASVAGLHLHSENESKWRLRTNPHLHRLEIYSLIAREIKPKDPLDGYGALRKFFRSRYVERDQDHLLRDGRSQCVGLNTGWVAA